VPAPPLEPVDPRAAQIQAGLEQKGLRVHEVVFEPAKGGNPPFWLSVTDATYLQPSGEEVFKQAFTIWEVMHSVLSGEDASSWLRAGEVWQKYLLIFSAQLGSYATLRQQYAAAATDEERERALDAFAETIRVIVYDLETRQAVDDKDFINKNFTGQ